MSYNFAAAVFTRKSFVAEFLREKPIFEYEKTVTLHFETPMGACRATFAVNLMLIGKLVVDFLVIIELFFARCHNARVTRLTDKRTDRGTMQRGKKLLHTCTYYQTLNTVSKQSHVNVESGHETPISKIVHELKTVFHRQQKCIRLYCSSQSSSCKLAGCWLTAFVRLASYR